MYIRFESTLPDTDARCCSGVFTAAFDIWYDRTDLTSLWQVQEMRRVLDWFNEHLKKPEHFYYRPNRKAEISGICWFHASAHSHVSQARYLAWLLNDIGQPIVTRTASAPGRVLWQDNHQVVAAQTL